MASTNNKPIPSPPCCQTNQPINDSPPCINTNSPITTPTCHGIGTYQVHEGADRRHCRLRRCAPPIGCVRLNGAIAVEAGAGLHHHRQLDGADDGDTRAVQPQLRRLLALVEDATVGGVRQLLPALPRPFDDGVVGACAVDNNVIGAPVQVQVQGEQAA